jgi:hypothetical protein
MLNIAVPQIVLDQPRVCALVGQGKAARMAQHVRVRVNGQVRQPAIVTDHHPGRLPAQRAAALTDNDAPKVASVINTVFHNNRFMALPRR